MPCINLDNEVIFMGKKHLTLKVLSTAMCLSIMTGTSASLMVNAAENTTQQSSISASQTAATSTVKEWTDPNTKVTYRYQLSGNITKVTRVVSKATEIRFPDTIDGHKNIQLQAKSITGVSCPNVKQVNLSSNVSKIEQNAFYQCNNLFRIMIDDNNTQLKISPNSFAKLKQIYANKNLSRTETNNLKSNITVTRYENVRNLSSISIEGAEKGSLVSGLNKKIILTAVTNITNGHFSFAIRNSKDSTYTVKQDWSTTTQYTLKLSKVGTYFIRVGVKDKNNVASYKYFKVTVKDQKFDASFVLNSKSYDMSQLGKKVAVNQKISFKVVPTTKNSTYKIEYKKHSKTEYTVLQKYGESTKSVQFKANVMYDIKISCKTPTGSVSTKTWSFTPISQSIGNKITVNITSQEGAVLSNFSFGLYQDTKLIKSVLTNQNGEAVFSDVAKGTYTIKMIKAAEGYALNTAVQTVSVQTNTQVTVTYPVVAAKTKGNLVLYAIPEVAGAKFRICKNGETKAVLNGVIDQEGKATVTLDVGNYTVQFISAPDTYNYAKGAFTFSIPRGGATVTLDVKNVFVSKTYPDLKTGLDITGITVPVRIAGKTAAGKSVSLTLKPDAEHHISVDLDNGVYTITLTKSPFEYELETYQIATIEIKSNRQTLVLGFEKY